MHTENISYFHQDQECKGYMAFHSTVEGPKPAILIAPDWSGRNDFACQKAEMLARLGYVGFVMDVYGDGKVGSTTEEKSKLIQPFLEDRQFLRDRLEAAFNFIKNQSVVDRTRIGAMGFCFGGLCVLDMARSGLDLKGVVSFHGLFGAPENLPNKSIQAKILALHGHDDPMAPPEQVLAFETEMTKAKADWQVHVYGNTEHAFTNPNAHDKKLGLIYNHTAETRALKSMQNFWEELFG